MVPANVHFDYNTPNSVSVSWDGGAGDNFWAVLSDEELFDTPISSEAVGSTFSRVYPGLKANTTYYFKLKFAAEDDSQYSVPIASAIAAVHPSQAAFAQVYHSSAAAQWSTLENSPSSEYQAEADIDPAFMLGMSFSSGPVSEALFSGFTPDTTVYLRVRTFGLVGADSLYTAAASTVTLAYPPGSEAYALVSSTGLSVFWNSNGNPGWTKYELTVSTEEGFATVNYSTALPANYYEAAGLLPNTTYYFKALAVNGSGVRTGHTVFSPALTYAAVPGANPPELYGEDAVSVQTRWSANDNPGQTEYYVQASTAADFTGQDYGPGTWAAGAERGVGGLDSGLLYHFRVRARDALGRYSQWRELGSRATLAGDDTTPPSVTDQQGGDDNWRGAAGGNYDVDFSDLGTGLDKFQVKVTTGPGFSGTVVSDWTDAVTGINSDAYVSDWTLPAAVFAAIEENVTSYVSVRVYDLASPANFTVKEDAFYVRRDTTPPTIANNAVSPAGWLAADPGAVFDVDFADALSGLASASYSAGSAPGLAGGDILSWTAVAGFAAGPAYTSLWGVDFPALRDGATNYISVRAVDAAGNQRLLADVFKILKNTVGPAVNLTAPSSAYVSTVTLITGAAAPMTETDPVAGVEVSLQELSSPNSYYYDGAAFASAAPVWLAAAGTLSWSYDASTAPFAAGLQYRAAARARDTDGLLTALPYPNASFRLDQVPPTVHLSTPLADSFVYALDAVEGTAADTGGAGLSAVEIYVRRALDGKWWNFVSGAWGDVAVASAAPAAASWTYTPGAGLRGALAHDQQYFIAAVAKDAAAPANTSGLGLIGSTITWKDTLPPEAVTAFAPSTGSAPGRVDVVWTFAGDDGGALALTYGRFAVQYSTYAGAVFSTQTAQVMISTAMVPAGAQLSYTVAGLAPETTYYLRLWVQDDAEFWSAPSPLASTLSGDRLNDTISGYVRTPAGTGVTGVMVDALTNTGAVAASAYTIDDGLGSFSLTPLPDGIYRVRATWLQDGFSNSIAKDQIPMGYADTNFLLSLSYELASVSGSLPASSPSGLRPAAAGGQAQLWRGASLLATAAADSSGRFVINNLIPGPYTLRVSADGAAWKTLEISLAPGQELRLQPLGTLADKAGTYVYPNPAANHAVFRVATAIYPVKIKLSVFSLDGALVKTSEYGEAGWTYADAATDVYEYRWDFSGGRPASGVYFCAVKLKDELGGGAETLTRKFAVIR
ncbi:MAG: fibronectin type III domain-containing protein [Elusimicrobiales bacterium]